MKWIYIVIFSTFIVSCKSKVVTYIPPPIVETQPSWDEGKQNSGLVGYIEGRGFLLTQGAASRYTFLTQKYGGQLNPPIEIGKGLTPYEDQFILSPEGMSIFMQLSRLNKSK